MQGKGDVAAAVKGAGKKRAALVLPVQPRASKAGTHLGFAKGVALPHGLPVQGFRATWVRATHRQDQATELSAAQQQGSTHT